MKRLKGKVNPSGAIDLGAKWRPKKLPKLPCVWGIKNRFGRPVRSTFFGLFLYDSEQHARQGCLKDAGETAFLICGAEPKAKRNKKGRKV